MKNQTKRIMLAGVVGLGVFLIYSASNGGDPSPEESPPSARSPSSRVEDLDTGSKENTAGPGDVQTEEEVAVSKLSKEEWEERIRNAPLNKKHGLFYSYVSSRGSQLDFGDLLNF